MPNTIKKIIYYLLGIFILLLMFFIIPFEHPIKRTLFLVAGVLGFIFLVLGIVLIILGRKEKGKLKVFLILTGLSTVAPLLFSVLHNLFYALGTIFKNLDFIFELLHGISFIIAMLVAPILFIIGVIGSIILMRKKK